MYDLAIINGKTYINGMFENTNAYVLNGKIAAIDNKIYPAVKTYDATNKLVIPGLIDPHVHFALGGKVKSVDDFETGSKSAAYGGITTFIDFLDPISKSEDLNDAFNSRKELASNSCIDYSFHLTVMNPKEVNKIVDKMKLYNLKSIKLFTTYSDSGRRTYDPEIKELLEYSSLGDYIVMAHIEKDDLINLNADFRVADLPISRPSVAETKEALHIAKLVKETKGKCYMVHLSSGETLKQLTEQYSELINTSFLVESCPHYFALTNDKYSQEDGKLFTMAPPLRSESESELLKNNFKYIYSIGTDHCSFTKENKNNKYLKDMPMGIGSVEHSFDIMYKLYGESCIDAMTINPAITFGLYPAKGHINIGADADLMIYDTNIQTIIEPGHSASDYTVYDGMVVNGKVESTISRGKFVVEKGEFLGGSGKFVLESK